jgi:hypothetical protein
MKLLHNMNCDFEPTNNENFSISLIFIIKWISDGYIVRNICYRLLLLIIHISTESIRNFSGAISLIYCVKNINIRCWNHKFCLIWKEPLAKNLSDINTLISGDIALLRKVELSKSSCSSWVICRMVRLSNLNLSINSKSSYF